MSEPRVCSHCGAAETEVMILTATPFTRHTFDCGSSVSVQDRMFYGVPPTGEVRDRTLTVECRLRCLELNAMSQV